MKTIRYLGVVALALVSGQQVVCDGNHSTTPEWKVVGAPRNNQCPVCGEMVEPYLNPAQCYGVMSDGTRGEIPCGPPSRVTRCKRCNAAFYQDAKQEKSGSNILPNGDSYSIGTRAIYWDCAKDGVFWDLVSIQQFQRGYCSVGGKVFVVERLSGTGDGMDVGGRNKERK